MSVCPDCGRRDHPGSCDEWVWPPEYNDVFDVLDAALLEHQKRVVERIKRGLDQIEWVPWYDHVDEVLDRESERPIRWPR